MNEQNSVTETSDREYVAIRFLNAPRELVWEAWTDPKHLAQWWGPTGFTNSFDEFDFKAGGHWRFTMHGPDGKNFLNHSVFKEIVPKEKIVVDHVTNPLFTITALFEDLGDKTKFTFKATFESAEVWNAVKPYAAPGNQQTLDRLEAKVKELKGQ